VQQEILDFEKMSFSERKNAVIEKFRLKIESLNGDDVQIKKAHKKFEEQRPYVHLTRQERSQLYEDSLDLVASHRGIRLFAEVVSKSHSKVLDKTVKPFPQAFQQVVARFDSFLKRIHHEKTNRMQKPKIENGLMIFDQDYANEPVMRKQFDEIRRMGHEWGLIRHVIDVPLFSPSQHLIGLQLADVCAYATRRYLDKGAVKESHEEKNFLRIASQFDHAGGQLHGLRHYTHLQSCSCWICYQRGHNTSSQENS
jgi:hypothetical protein